MRCSECRDRLDDYARNKLSPDQAEKIAAHLTECATCTDEYESLKSLLTLLESEPEQQIDQAELADFLPDVWEKIESGKVSPWKGWLYKFATPIAAAILLALVVFKPAIRTMTDYQASTGDTTNYIESDYYPAADLSYSDDEVYSESNYYAILSLLFADKSTELIDTLESELDYETIMYSDYRYSLDDLNDEALNYMNEKLNKLYNNEG